MINKMFMLLLISILFFFSINSKASCGYATDASFKQNYARNFQKENVFFIKGVALDVVEYGRHIKVIEDLKGNFKGDSTILVWGAGSPSSGSSCMTTEKLDYLTQYQENDTLIMLVSPVTFENCVEVFGGYTTFGCTYCVLKLSNGYVTGYIEPYIWGELMKETTMPWDELQKFLSNDGKVNAFEADSAVWTYRYACGSGPYVLYQTIIYGDTIIDDVKWKIVTDLFTGKGLVRTEEKKVIYKGKIRGDYSDEEITVYDFSLNVGDSILAFIDYKESIKVEINEIDSIVLNDGKKYKRMKAGNYNEVIEGIGFSRIHPFHMLIALPTCASGPDLICCHVNDELLYINPDFLDCDGTYVSNETISDISPKPVISFRNEQLIVKFDGDVFFDVVIYNMQGMMLFQTKNNHSEMLTNLDNFPKGVYIVKVNSGNYVYSEKIVK